MNIEFIKSEFEKLTLILRSWKEGQNISTIERDIVLDKLKNIYDAVRFTDGATAGEEPAAAATAAPQRQETPVMQADSAKTPGMPAAETAAETEEDGDEVEVEFIFDDEQDSPAPESDTDTEDTEEEPAVKEGQMDMDGTPVIEIPETPAATPQAATEPLPAAETPAAEIPAAAAEAAVPEPDADTAEGMAAAPHAGANDAAGTDAGPVNDEPGTAAAQRPMNSLFGSDEVKHHQPSRHHRMMSIYDYDTEPKPEKVVDISKIFDNEDYAPDARYDTDRYDTTDSHARRSGGLTAAEDESAHTAEEGVTTIADAMAASQHTLADTLTRPAPLAEQITHSATTSLRDAIGINDKFLLIRDLFAGDEHEYEKAVSELDSFDNLDDCMIYIVENYAWNPNSEGAKFMMQLLERKLS